jgi:REP element-mobilizing transposase RayT
LLGYLVMNTIRAVSEWEKERLEKLRRQQIAARARPAAPPSDTDPGGLVQGWHSRGYLPHLKQQGASYFVTFRLADSLPAAVLAELEAGRSQALARASLMPTQGQRREAIRLAEAGYETAVDKALAAGAGHCWLARPDVAALVARALGYFAGQRYTLRAWVVMPNHVHAVLRPLAGWRLGTLLHSWKSYTAKEALRLLEPLWHGEDREFWQRESYDHLCRDEEDERLCCQYVERNPVAAGLCEKAEQWHWSSAWREVP